jgi:hypothetical protein
MCHKKASILRNFIGVKWSSDRFNRSGKNYRSWKRYKKKKNFTIVTTLFQEEAIVRQLLKNQADPVIVLTFKSIAIKYAYGGSPE